MNRRLSVFNTFITEKVLTTIYYIIQHFDLIKDTFEKLYRNAITCHADNFVTREQNATFMYFGIVFYDISIIFVCESHEQQTFSWS